MKAKNPAVQFEETSEEAKSDEDCKMEVDSEANSRRKLEPRKKEDYEAVAKTCGFHGLG